MTDSTERAPVHSWLAHRLQADVAEAIDRLARTDDARHIAVMPDVHLSHEVCVGTVLATSQLIYPNAVGGDIGCGMAAIAFDEDADVLRNESRAARLLTSLPAVVPAMRRAKRNVSSELPGELDATALSDPRLETVRRRDGIVQLGTLGRGNHFLEFQADDEDRLWLMIHSGSRAIGQAVRDLHIASAKRSSTGHWFLDAHTPHGQAYLHDAEWARAYARANRRAMIDAAVALMQTLFSVAPIADSCFDCDHNHVRREVHFGEELWVHRKGAAPAGQGVAGVIPGSMGTESYHVEGRGCAEALHSSSHGAGRAMSRGDAMQKIPERELARQLEGVWYDHRIAGALRDEAPSAYKDVRVVMKAQRELTRITRRLRPVLVYKSG